MTTGMKQQLAPRLFCRRPILSAVNPCRVAGCKHEAAHNRRLCAGHEVSERNRHERAKQRKRAAIWGAGGEGDNG